jgi:hypothetical protein
MITFQEQIKRDNDELEQQEEKFKIFECNRSLRIYLGLLFINCCVLIGFMAWKLNQ